MANIIPITDFSDGRLEVYTSLSENQLRTFYEPHGGLFIAESPKVILRALDAGYRPLSFLTEPKHIEGWGQPIFARFPEVPVYTAPLNVLNRLTGFSLTRGLLCAMHRKALPSVEELCKNAHRIAVLEEVVNPTNVGAIFRSAAALGMDALLLTPACSDPLYRRAARVSMGTVFQIPWTFFTEKDIGQTSDVSQYLHRFGFKTAAMALSDDSVSVRDAALAAEEKLAVILGTEGDGLSAHTIAACDYTVRIPMSHGVDSLNVAAAGAIAFWELGRR